MTAKALLQLQRMQQRARTSVFTRNHALRLTERSTVHAQEISAIEQNAWESLSTAKGNDNVYPVRLLLMVKT